MSRSIDPAPRASRAGEVVRDLLRSREVAVAAVLVLLIALTTLKSESFLFSSDGFRNLLVTPSLLLLLAVGQTVVIITRNVDLSVGSVLGLTAYLTGRLFVDFPGIPIVVVFLAGLAMGAVLGLVNGLLVAFGKVPALVITLGTLYIYRGIFLSWAGSDRINASDMPAGFLALGTRSILGIPVLTVIALLVLAAVGYHLHHARSYPAYSHPLWRRALLSREFAIIVLLLAVYTYSLVEVPAFDGPLTLYYLFLDIAPILLIALPMTMIIITGEIDLSVASVVGLSSVLTGMLHQEAGLSIPVAGLVAILVGALCGALNGFLVSYVGLPSLAVTIGTLALYRGVAVGLLGTTAVTDFPEFWTDLAKQRIVEGQPYPMILLPFLALLLLFVWMLHFSPFGRGVVEIGLNKEAAHFTGVNVERTKFWLFVMAGAVSALAGIYYTLRYGSARGDNATGLELQVIAAVLLGGVSIFGGRGALHGVIAGVVLIGVISSAMRLEAYPVNVINIVIGVLLVLSVISTSLLTWASGLAASRRRARSGASSSAPTVGR